VKQRIHIAVRGAVQGVGFRPFVFRLAREMGLPGWVLNSPQGVFIEVEGERGALESFVLRLQNEKPPRSFLQSLEFRYLDPVGFTGFEIRPSETGGKLTALVLPDIATCPDCLADILDQRNRRFRYPFTNCTNCGPRYSIIRSLPYDRANTSMRQFEMCRDCRHEYEDPADRRFHAQPNACPVCGPWLELWDADGNVLADRDEALGAAAAALRGGRVAAVKGLGGFHLMADARCEGAVEELRRRKHREEKPFAVMYPSLESMEADCELSSVEARLLASPESPIVLARRRRGAGIVSASVAPRNPNLGVMLPYTPLHHLLMKELGFPVVATSGNLSEEPICIEEREALRRLHGIADVFLAHNRPIVRHVDDSIVRVVLGRELVMRRSRGYAPLPLQSAGLASGTLAVGGHMKNTVAVSVDGNIFVSQHIGDLENSQAADAFREVVGSFQKLYGVDPARVAADLHPDYFSTRFAAAFGRPVVPIQHHYAHVAACMAENQLDSAVLGVAWDGTGYGEDGTVWGGEFLLTDERSFRRVGHLRRFRLPGGNQAIRQPRRTALGLLYEIFGDSGSNLPQAATRTFSDEELRVVLRMLARGINSPLTSSAGRLFDAVASLTGLRQTVNFEGQAAMELEFALEGAPEAEPYPFKLADLPQAQPAVTIVDWEPMVRGVLSDVEREVPVGTISRRFHDTLAEIIVAMASLVGEKRVVLTGGCFQNRYLTERAVGRLQDEGFRPYWHQRIPPNDGGIAVGQAVAASRLLK
jgi:hydrogenase maturation protein HypF